MIKLKEYLIYNNRVFIVLSLIIVIPLGFGLKYYSGPLSGWVNNNAAGILFEVFWILFVFLFVTKEEVLNKIPVLIFIITSFLEFLQLWHPTFLEIIRSNFLGRTLIGTTFSWLDFPHYILGCIIGWIWIIKLSKISKKYPAT